MAIFERFPYSDLHNLNLDAIIAKVKQWQAEFEEYKTELETLESAVQGLINTVNQQDEDIQAALGRLQTALAALPSDIQAEVAEQIGPEVASRIGPTVASQLPDVVTSQIGGAVDDWMEDNFTNPPFDPYLTRDLAVPVAKDMGDRFDYLKTLQIEGYTPAWSNALVTTVDDAGFWKADGTIDSSDSTTAAGYCTSEPGVSYRFTEWVLRNTETVAVLFCRGTISDKVVHSYINKADLGDYETASGSGIYIIPVPYGCNLMLVNGIGGDPPDFPVIAEQTLNFRGGTRVRSFMQIAPGGNAVYASDYPSILSDIQKGVPVSFNNVPDQTSTTYFTVVGYSVNYQANTIDIAMVSPDKKLLTARLIKTTAGGIDYAMITSIEETSIGGGSPGPTPVSSSIVVNLTAGQNNTFTGNISLGDLQSALDDAESIWLSYPGATANDYDLRQVVEYNQDLTDNTSLRIGVFSEDEYIVYSVVDNGNDGVTLTVVSETAVGGDILPTVTSLDADKGLVVNSSGEWTKSMFPMTTWLSLPSDDNEICLSDVNNRIKSKPVNSIKGIGAQTLDLTVAHSTIEQLLAGMRMLAGAAVGEPTTRYVDMTGPTGIGLAAVLRTSLSVANARQKYIKVVIGNNISTAYYYYYDASDVSVYTGKVEFTITEYDTSASKKYVHDIAMAEVSDTSARIYITTTCTNFSSLN